MANFRYTPFVGAVDTEFEFTSLYLHHIGSGKNPTQADIIVANATTGWGQTSVNNWTIYDGVGPSAKLAARAQGLCINAGNLHNTFTIRFETERFKDSTLQVMGISVEQEGEWSIVGGTGKLAMAHGVITKKLHQKIDGGDIIQLTIHGFCYSKMSTSGESGSSDGGGTSTLPPPPPPITPTKSGPWGGIVGSDVDSVKPTKVKSIIIRTTADSVDSFEYSYVDQNGKTIKAGPWGTGEKILAEITLGPDEILMEVSGEASVDYVYKLKFVTNKTDYGPFGKDIVSHIPFVAKAPPGKEIVGFFGSTREKYLEAIGVYIA